MNRTDWIVDTRGRAVPALGRPAVDPGMAALSRRLADPGARAIGWLRVCRRAGLDVAKARDEILRLDASLTE